MYTLMCKYTTCNDDLYLAFPAPKQMPKEPRSSQPGNVDKGNILA